MMSWALYIYIYIYMAAMCSVYDGTKAHFYMEVHKFI